MNFNKAILGVYGAALLLVSIVIFGALEPGYSHKFNSVSSLGALSAQHTFAFNIFGLMFPGLLVSLAFYYQYLSVVKRKIEKSAYLLMVVFGLMFASLALPMDLGPLPGVGVTAHYVLAYSSVIPFLLSSALYLYVYRKSLLSYPWILALPLAFVVIDLLKGSGVIAGGAAQRGLLACLFLWAALVCIQNVKKHKN